MFVNNTNVYIFIIFSITNNFWSSRPSLGANKTVLCWLSWRLSQIARFPCFFFNKNITIHKTYGFLFVLYHSIIFELIFDWFSNLNYWICTVDLVKYFRTLFPQVRRPGWDLQKSCKHTTCKFFLLLQFDTPYPRYARDAYKYTRQDKRLYLCKTLLIRPRIFKKKLWLFTFS